MKSLENLLVQELFSGEKEKSPSRKIRTFLSSLDSALSGIWSSSDKWDSPQITRSLILGEVSFKDLESAISPEQLIQATTKVVLENWDIFVSDISLQPEFSNDLPDLNSAREFIQNAGSANSASKVQTHLSAFVATLTPSAKSLSQQQAPIPETLKNELVQNLRSKAEEIEKKWLDLALPDLNAELLKATQEIEKKRRESPTPLTENEEKKQKALLVATEKLNSFRESIKNERYRIVQNLIAYSFPGSVQIDRQKFSNVFSEHNIREFNPENFDSSVQMAQQAEAFWQDLTEKGVDDASFYFSVNILDGYRNFINQLTQKENELQAASQALASEIRSALDLSTQPPSPEIPDTTGAENEEITNQLLTPEVVARLEKLWKLQLAELDAISRSITNAVTEETRASFVTSLQTFSRDVGLTISGTNLAGIIDQLLASEFSTWIHGKALSEIETILDRFAQLLAAMRAMLEKSEITPLTPGQAAEKAQATIDELQSEPNTPLTESQEVDPEKLKNLSKLTRAHAALTGIALSELETKLKALGYSESEIETYIELNQAAVAQYMWTQHLTQLQNEEAPLGSNEVFRLALNGSLFFVEKFELEKGNRLAALGPESFDLRTPGELTPELRAKLDEVALRYGYESSDELFMDLYGTGDRQKALTMFLDNAEFAAGLDQRTIALSTEKILEKYFAKGGVKSGDALISRFMSSLEKDKLSLELFFSQNPDNFSSDQKKRWQELEKLIKRYTDNQPLSPKDIARMDELFLEMYPIIALYSELGIDFYTLRHSQGFQNFLVQASRYGSIEDTLEQDQLQKGKKYPRLIPAQFSRLGSNVMRLRQQKEPDQIRSAKITKSSRTDIALQIAVARNFAKYQNVEFDKIYLWIEEQNFIEVGILSPPATVAGTQRRSQWPVQTMANVGKNASGTSQVLAQVASGGKINKGKLASNILKNPAVRKAVLQLLAIVVPKLAILGTGALAIYLAAKPFIDFFSNLFGGGSAGGTSLVTSGLGSTIGAEVSTAVADGGSKAVIAAKSVAQSTGEAISTGLSTTSGQVSAWFTATTTAAAVSGSIVAGGIIAPILGLTLMTIVVWAVIGNSFNDYGGGGLGTVRRGLGIEGCWPTAGVITVLRTYPGGSPHAVSPGGSAIDIGGEALEPVYTPFGGRARAYSVSQVAGTGNSGYGNYIRVKTDLGFDLIFAHLEAYEVSDTQEVVVNPGDLIGGMGTTGTSTGNHLHYELIDMRRSGLEIYDITPLPEEQLRIGLPVSPTGCSPTSQPQPTETPRPVIHLRDNRLTFVSPTTP